MPRTWGTILVGLFDPARLALLPDELADHRSLGNSTVVTRSLLAQINISVVFTPSCLSHLRPQPTPANVD